VFQDVTLSIAHLPSPHYYPHFNGRFQGGPVLFLQLFRSDAPYVTHPANSTKAPKGMQSNDINQENYLMSSVS